MRQSRDLCIHRVISTDAKRLSIQTFGQIHLSNMFALISLHFTIYICDLQANAKHTHRRERVQAFHMANKRMQKKQNEKIFPLPFIDGQMFLFRGHHKITIKMKYKFHEREKNNGRIVTTKYKSESRKKGLHFY